MFWQGSSSKRLLTLLSKTVTPSRVGSGGSVPNKPHKSGARGKVKQSCRPLRAPPEKKIYDFNDIVYVGLCCAILENLIAISSANVFQIAC